MKSLKRSAENLMKHSALVYEITYESTKQCISIACLSSNNYQGLQVSLHLR